MISELLRKWFGLDNPSCETCEVLRSQLDESNRERRELLHKLLTKDQAESVTEKDEEPQPIRPQYTPWNVRKQLLEAEDRKKYQLLRENAQNIAKLENELGVAADESAPSGGVKFKEAK